MQNKQKRILVNSDNDFLLGEDWGVLMGTAGSEKCCHHPRKSKWKPV